jgi:phosphoglycolate phosphatase
LKLVIFDVDGTLIDSQHMIVAAMNAAFGAHSLVPPSREEILSIVGLSLETAMRALCKSEPKAFAVPLADAYKAAFQDLRRSPEHHEPFYDGAAEAIRSLQARGDVTLGIATGKSRRGVDAILDLHGLHGRFATIQTADLHPSKPHPSMIHAALRETGSLPQETLMLGDTTFDMEMARAAGVHAVGVSWGYHEVAALEAAGAHRVLARFSELDAAVDDLLLEVLSA